MHRMYNMQTNGRRRRPSLPTATVTPTPAAGATARLRHELETRLRFGYELGDLSSAEAERLLERWLRKAAAAGLSPDEFLGLLTRDAVVVKSTLRGACGLCNCTHCLRPR